MRAIPTLGKYAHVADDLGDTAIIAIQNLFAFFVGRVAIDVFCGNSNFLESLYDVLAMRNTGCEYHSLQSERQFFPVLNNVTDQG